MEETNVTMTAEEMQGEPAAKENETKAENAIGRLQPGMGIFIIMKK